MSVQIEGQFGRPFDGLDDVVGANLARTRVDRAPARPMVTHFWGPSVRCLPERSAWNLRTANSRPGERPEVSELVIRWRPGCTDRAAVLSERYVMPQKKVPPCALVAGDAPTSPRPSTIVIIALIFGFEAYLVSSGVGVCTSVALTAAGILAPSIATAKPGSLTGVIRSLTAALTALSGAVTR